MDVRSEPRWKLLELGLAVLILLTPLFLLGAPNEWFYGQSYATPIGILSGVGVWVVPALLSAFALYRAIRTGVTIRTIIIASLGGLTLLILLVNFHTTATSPGGPLRYGGRGAFFGPFVSLFTGCLLAVAVLLDEFGRRNVVRSAGQRELEK